ncbi:hypothetical protein DFH09DRAFT_1159975 [Mycena vulgaris]|nr:hypothetical protein DFH09DRAFT_1159975 [Mycena vulgaris]
MASTPSPNGQKRARKCRTCLMPMKGHKAETCVAVQLPATPPASPPNAPTGTRNRGRNNIEIGIERHWRDPSWTPHVTLAAPLAPSDGPSLIPTVLVDEDGHTILGSHEVVVASDASGDAESVFDADGHAHTPRPKTPMAQVMDQAHALRLCEPLVSIVTVRVADLPRMQATAGQSGLCTSIVRAPWTAPRFKDEFAPGVNWDPEDEKTMWVVVGGDPTLVQRTADLQQQYERIPGAIKDDLVVVQATYKHIFLASAVSALVVLAAMSVLV